MSKNTSESIPMTQTGGRGERTATRGTRAGTLTDIWLTQEDEQARLAFQDKYSKQVWRVQNCIWFLVYGVFLLILLIVLLVGRDVERTHEMMSAIKDTLIDEEFLFNNSQIPKNYLSIQQVEEFWDWLTGPFANALDNSEWYNGDDKTGNDTRMVYFYNRIIGDIRLRQLRVEESACSQDWTSSDWISVQRLNKGFDKCYFEYSTSTQTRVPFGPNGTYTYTLESQTNIPFELGRAIFAQYPGGGYIKDIPIDKINDEFAKLKANKWIDKQTRVVFVNANFFNGNLRTYLVAQMMIEFTAGGWVYPYFSLTPFRLDPYVDMSDYVRMGCEVLLVLILTLFTFVELQEMWRGGSAMYAIVKHQPIHIRLMQYFQKDMWNVVDWINLGVFWAMVSLYISYTADPLRESIDLFKGGYQNLEAIAYRYQNIYNIAAFNVLLTVVKMFKYLQINQRLQVLWKTLYVAGKDLVAYVIFFMIVFFGFAVYGHLLFGPDMFEYRDLQGSLLACFRMILGEYDYRELWRINRLLGPFYFIAFVILVYFALANMFIAIINEAWGSVMEPIRSRERKKQRIKEILDQEEKGPASPLQRRMTGRYNPMRGSSRFSLGVTNKSWASRTLDKTMKKVKFVRQAMSSKRTPEAVTTDFYNVVNLVDSPDKEQQRKAVNEHLGSSYPRDLLEWLLNEYRKIREEASIDSRGIQEMDSSLRPLAEALVDTQNRIEVIEARTTNIINVLERIERTQRSMATSSPSAASEAASTTTIGYTPDSASAAATATTTAVKEDHPSIPAPLTSAQDQGTGIGEGAAAAVPPPFNRQNTGSVRWARGEENTAVAVDDVDDGDEEDSSTKI